MNKYQIAVEKMNDLVSYHRSLPHIGLSTLHSPDRSDLILNQKLDNLLEHFLDNFEGPPDFAPNFMPVEMREDIQQLKRMAIDGTIVHEILKVSPIYRESAFVVAVYMGMTSHYKIKFDYKSLKNFDRFANLYQLILLSH